MSNWCFIAKIGIVFIILLKVVAGRPQDNHGSTTETVVGKGHENKTKPRILTHFSKIEFGQEQNIVFPDSSQDKIDTVSRIGGDSKCADHLPLCEEVDSYPYNHLKRILQENPILKVLFGQDEVSEITNRIGDEDEKFVCRSIIKTIFPKLGQNNNNEWKFIINQGKEDGFVQGVQTEVCQNPDTECDIPGTLSIDSLYETSCKQKYIYRRLLSVNNEGTPVPDTFKIPSACCCAYKQKIDFLSRIGRDSTPARKLK